MSTDLATQHKFPWWEIQKLVERPLYSGKEWNQWKSSRHPLTITLTPAIWSTGNTLDPSFFPWMGSVGLHIQCSSFSRGFPENWLLSCLSQIMDRNWLTLVTLEQVRKRPQFRLAVDIDHLPGSVQIKWMKKSQLLCSPWGTKELPLNPIPRIFLVSLGQMTEFCLACLRGLQYPTYSWCPRASENKDHYLNYQLAQSFHMAQHRENWWKPPAPRFSLEKERVGWSVQWCNFSRGTGFSFTCLRVLMGAGIQVMSGGH